MSRVRADQYTNNAGTGSPLFTHGVRVTGVATATTFDGNLTGDVTGNVTGNITGIADTATNAEGLIGVPNVIVGVASASQFKGTDGNTAFFYGDGSGLINVTPSSTAGINIKNDDTVIGVAATINFGANLDVSPASAGIVTVTEAPYTTTATATGKTLINREYCTVTAAGQTITLPATPTAGDEVGIQVGNFTDTVVARNGSNIMALAEDFTMDIAYLAVQLVYIDATQGWRFV